MENLIEVYENALPDNICDEMVKTFKENMEFSKPGGVGLGDINPDVKKSTDLNFLKLRPSIVENLAPHILKALNNGLYKYFIKYKMYNINEEKNVLALSQEKFLDEITYNEYIIDRSSFHAKMYFKGDGFFDWHIDQGQGDWRIFCRELVMMFYLNDVKEGGETGFLFQDVNIKPKKGSLVIFPAHFTHTHRGAMPKSNDKYILNFWLLKICPPIIDMMLNTVDPLRPGEVDRLTRGNEYFQQ